MSDAKIVLSAVDETKAAFQAVQGSLAGLKTSATSVTGALGALGVAGAAVGFAATIKGAIDAADHLNKLSQRTGIAAESLSQLQFAAKLSDVSAESLTSGIKKLNVSIAEGLGGDKAKVEIFKNLGISLRDASGQAKTADKVLLEMAGSFSIAKDGAAKTAYAVGLMGKAGDEMIPLLNGGTDAIKEMMDKANKLGLTISTDFAKQAETFNDNLTILKASGDKLAISLGSDLVAGLGRTAKAMADAAVEGGKLAGILAGVQTLLTGDDRHKANVAMVSLADKILEGENALMALQAGNSKNKNAFAEEEIRKKQISLKLMREEFDMHKRVGVEIDKAAAKAEDKAPKQTTSLKALTGGAGKTSSEYDSIIKSIKEKIATQDLELEKGRQLTEFEKFEVKILTDLDATKKTLTETQRAAIKGVLAEAAANDRLLKSNKDRIAAAREINDYYNEQESEQGADRAARDNERNRVDRGISDQAIALGEMNQQLKLEGSLMGATELQRTIMLGNLKIELDTKRKIEEVDRNLLLDESERVRMRANILQNAGEEKAQLQLRAGIDDFRGVWESVDRTAHDTFVNIFEGGKDAFTKLRDTLKSTLLDLLYQMTVKKWIFNIGASITSGGGGAGGAAGLLGGSFGSGAMDTVRNIGSIGSLQNIGTLAAGGEILGAIGAAAPYIGIALGAISLFSKSGGGPKTEAGYAAGGLSIAGLDIGGKQQGSQRGDVGAAQKIGDGISASYAALADKLGLMNKKLDVGIFYSMDNAKGGTSLTQLQVTTSAGYNRSNRTGGIENVARGDQALQAALAEETIRALVDGLKSSDLAQQFKDVLNGLAPDSGITEMQAALDRITNAKTQQATLEDQLFNLTATDLEKLNKTRARERAAIDPLNAALLEQVYAQQDLATATAEATAAAAAEAERAKAVAGERAGLERRIMQLTGDVAGIRKLELAALDESNRALQERIWNLEDEETASRAATTAAKSAMDAYYAASDAWYAGQMAAARQFDDKKIAADKALFDTGKSISDFLRGLSASRMGTASPEALLAANRSNYLSDLSLAKAGNADASGRITGSAQAYLEAQKDYTASRATTQAVISQVISELSALPSVQSYESQSLSLMQQQLSVQQTTAQVLTSAITGGKNSGKPLDMVSMGGNTVTLTDGTKLTWEQYDAYRASFLPSFDVGTPMVPGNMMANIHSGERILTAAENSDVTANMSAMVTELRSLREEVGRLTQVSADGLKQSIGVQMGIEKNTKPQVTAAALPPRKAVA